MILMGAEDRLAQLKLELPAAPKPVATYVTALRVGDMLYVSGHGPLRSDGTMITGKLGLDLDLAAGMAAARQTGLAILATVREHLGSLDRVERLIKTLGMVNSTPEYGDQPKVINGYSDLMRDVFGDAGVGTRSAVGMGCASRRNCRGNRGHFSSEGVTAGRSASCLIVPREIFVMPTAGRLQNRSCLIVGGTSGIGLATAHCFLAEGAFVVVCGRSEQTADAGAAELEQNARGRSLVINADAADPAQVERLFQQALEFCSGRLDILFHVAGISGRRFGDGALDECTVEGWDTVLNANARSLFLTNRAAVRQMLCKSLTIMDFAARS